MLLQPILEKMEKLDGYGGASRLEICLKRQDLFGESLMFGPVRGQGGIVVQAHEALFVGKMDGSVLHQAVQNPGVTALP